MSTAARWQYTPWWPRLAALAGFATIALIYLPIVWLVVMSFSARPLSGVPFPLTFEWYAKMAADTRWRAPMLTSLGVAGGVAVICALLATVLGRAIMRLKRPAPVIALTLLPLFVPGLTVGAALFLFLRVNLGLRLGLWSVVLAHVLWALPFALLLLLVLLSRFDRRLLQAAADLGASGWQTFWLIEWPILRPAVAGATIFGFLLSFSELPRSLFLRGTTTTMPIFQWAQNSDHQSYVPISFALATVIIAISVPVLVGFMAATFGAGRRM